MKDKSKQVELLSDKTEVSNKIEDVESTDKPTLNVDDGSLVQDKALSGQNEKSMSERKPPEKEINGPKGLEPTRYGDWESKGRCYDF